MKNAQTFLVGGAVRDMLMGKSPKDRDFVVVGSTSEEMLAQKYSQVGADFPVFLHPVSGDEHALARRERKTGVGYLGFEVEFGTDVTLEEDLARRDLTINAMAFEDDEGNPGSFLLFDPFGGRDDLHNKVLRHVSAGAFREDPVRVLRLARFRARFGAEWTVDAETRHTVNKMGCDGVLSELNSERVWKEMSRALTEPHPRLFFDTLLECDVLHFLFPEVWELLACQENLKWHPEGNTYEHTMLVLTAAAKLNPGSVEAAFFALTHDFGKTQTPVELQPKYYGHEKMGVKMVGDFATRVSAPAKMRKDAMTVSRFHMHMHKLGEMKSSTVVKMLTEMDAFRNPEVVRHLTMLGMADARGRLGHEDTDVTDRLDLLAAFSEARKVKFEDLNLKPGTKPEGIKDAFARERTHRVFQLKGK